MGVKKVVVITHVKKRMMFLITHFCKLGLKNDIHEYQIYKKKKCGHL